MSTDWIKLHRQTIDSRVFSDAFLLQLWVWCLLKANWKRSWFQGREIEPGQFATGRSNAADELGVSGSKWYRGMQRLAEFGNVKIESVNNRFSLIEVVNWRVYQGNEPPRRTTSEQPANNRRTTGEQPVNTIEEGKKVKKERKEDKSNTFIYSDAFETFWSAFPKGRKTGKRKAFSAWKRAITSATTEEIIAAANDYAASGVGRGEFVKGPESWLNGGCWDDDREAWKDKKTPGVKTFHQQKTETTFSAGQRFLASRQSQLAIEGEVVNGS